LSSLINLKKITKIYQTGDITTTGLDDINLSIAQGEFIAIMGESGSGKSTLLNILGLLDRPTGGEYFLHGKEIRSLTDDELANERNQSFGFIFQSFFLLSKLTAEKNIMLPLLYRGNSIWAAKKKANEMLKKLEIGELAKRKPAQLSGGQQQRVAIARALVGDPDVVIADEPTGALDHETGKEIMKLLKGVHKDRQKTVILVTHDENLGKTYCERLVMVMDGRIQSDTRKTE